MIKHFTVSYYFKVQDSGMYGGQGTIGYISADLSFENKMNGTPESPIDDMIKNFSELLDVSTDNIISISKSEFEENAEDD